MLTLIRCPFHPRVTAVACKRPRSFCQQCRWQVTPKHEYTLDLSKSEWADYAAVQAECGNLSGNKFTRNSSGNTRSQLSQLAESQWIDLGLKSGISLRELISLKRKKKKKRRRGMNCRTFSQILAREEKATPTSTFVGGKRGQVAWKHHGTSMTTITSCIHSRPYYSCTVASQSHSVSFPPGWDTMGPGTRNKGRPPSLCVLFAFSPSPIVHQFHVQTLLLIIIYPLTARVVGAPQMISQPVSSIFPCSPLPSETCQTPGLSIP